MSRLWTRRQQILTDLFIYRFRPFADERIPISHGQVSEDEFSLRFPEFEFSL